MAYTRVVRWSHGDQVTAANMNILSDNIEYLYSLSGGIDANFAVPQIGGSDRRPSYTVVHRFRWLWYRGSGNMEDFAGNNDTSLDSGDAWAVALDLDTLGWLFYGSLYTVSGVSWAMETPDA